MPEPSPPSTTLSASVEPVEESPEEQSDDLLSLTGEPEGSSQQQQQQPSVHDCAQYYSHRLRRLTQLKRQSTDSQMLGLDAAGAGDDGGDGEQQQPMFTRIKSDMMQLMEQDVRLMRQLLALSDMMDGLKSTTATSTTSTSSHRHRPGDIVERDEYDDDDDEEEDFYDELPNSNGSGGGVTSIEIGTDSPTMERRRRSVMLLQGRPLARTQYFSRQNSVLRIPIPPAHGHRRQQQQQKLAKTFSNASDKSNASTSTVTTSSSSSTTSGSNASKTTTTILHLNTTTSIDVLPTEVDVTTTQVDVSDVHHCHTPAQHSHRSDTSADSGIPGGPANSASPSGGSEADEVEVFV